MKKSLFIMLFLLLLNCGKDKATDSNNQDNDDPLPSFSVQVVNRVDWVIFQAPAKFRWGTRLYNINFNETISLGNYEQGDYNWGAYAGFLPPGGTEYEYTRVGSGSYRLNGDVTFYIFIDHVTLID